MQKLVNIYKSLTQNLMQPTFSKAIAPIIKMRKNLEETAKFHTEEIKLIEAYRSKITRELIQISDKKNEKLEAKIKKLQEQMEANKEVCWALCESINSDCAEKTLESERNVQQSLDMLERCHRLEFAHD